MGYPDDKYVKIIRFIVDYFKTLFIGIPAPKQLQLKSLMRSYHREIVFNYQSDAVSLMAIMQVNAFKTLRFLAKLGYLVY